MSDFAKYDATTGEVVAVGQMEADQLAYQVDPIYVGLVDPLTQYVNVGDGSLMDRPWMVIVADWSATTLAANGVSTVTLGSSLPSNTTIDISMPLGKGLTDVTGITETSGTFAFATPVTGTYIITAKAFPFKDLVTSIVAT